MSPFSVKFFVSEGGKMPVIISGIKTALNADKDKIFSKALKSACLKLDDVKKIEIHKTSLDARDRNNIRFVHSVFIELFDLAREKDLCNRLKSASYCENFDFSPCLKKGNENKKVVVIGFGPAGMFSALVLAENGIKPIVIERGEPIEKRVSSVDTFMNGGALSVNSSIQFGEGGAGTFSDGKLTSRIKDKLCRYVLKRFAEFGAPEEILTKSKAHIGTDNLRSVVKSIRERILSLGGEIYFETKLEDFTLKNGRICEIKTNSFSMPVDDVILAIGHSARDTFELLLRKNIFLESKPFSVGVRIEHRQRDVDFSLYGSHAGNPLLPKGEYQLSKRNKDGRAVYTFCMCPGGYVVPASSEEKTVVTNGMSEFSRNGENANSALVVSVSSKDYGDKPLDGVRFQRAIESSAYKLAGEDYSAPATTVGGFLSRNPSIKSNLNGTYSRGLRPVEFRDLFPAFVTDMLEVGLYDFSKKMKCFGDENAILTAPETRTSSPVRIIRTDSFRSLNCENLYPCGEGAGYAGGIMSASVDGIKVALQIIEN